MSFFLACSMSIIIRHATAADAENIAALSRQTFYDTFAEFNTKEDMEKFMNESFSMQALIREVETPGNIFLAAFMEDELAGYAKLTASKNPPELEGIAAIEIGRIYAAQKTIGHGVGKALMQECISTAIKENKQVIWLGVWEHNQRAISFYKKFGFDKFGEHDFVLGNDVQTDWLMKKKI
jgi:ribosomal protein S18 acetylase RimI-like enzyme